MHSDGLMHIVPMCGKPGRSSNPIQDRIFVARTFSKVANKVK